MTVLDAQTRHDDLVATADAVLGGSLSGQLLLEGDDAVVMARGEGSHVVDVRGRRYLDLLLGSGPVLLGHAHPEVTRALHAQVDRGTTFYALNDATVELSRRLTEVVPCAEAVKFVGSGGDSTFHALRMARVHTGRPRILKFEGGFHGVHDDALVSAFSPAADYPRGTPDSAGLPASIDDRVMVARYNDLDMVEDLLRRHGHEIAAVICEPIQRVLMPAPGFLEGLRRLTTEHGVLLVFDEMVTGFRLARGGAQEHFGVTPDLATFGKALTNGLPMACVVGRRDVISTADPVARREGRPAAMFGGTLNGNALCGAAGLAVLDVLSRPGTYERLWELGDALRAGAAERAAAHGLDVQVAGAGPFLQVLFTDRPIVDIDALRSADRDLGRRFGLELLRRGVLNSLGKLYVSLVHTDDDVATAVTAFDGAFAALADG